MVIKIPKVSFSTIFIIIPILYFNSCTFEFIKHFSFVLPIVAVCVLLWFAFLIKERVDMNIHIMAPMIGFVILLGVLFLLTGNNRVPVLMTDLTNTIYLLIFMFIFSVYSDKQYENDRSVILSIWLVDTVISCIYSIYRLIDEPNLSRMLSTGTYHTTEEAIRARGIISFGVIYGLALFLIALFYLIIMKKEKRIVNIILLTLFITALFLAQFLIAVILAAIGFVWIIFINNPGKADNTRLRVLGFIIIGVICILGLPLFISLSTQFQLFGYEINARLEEILLLFKGENLEGTDILARFSQYFISLSAFVSSFGLGKIAFSSVQVGSHSQWLDGFGNYGIIFALYIVAFFIFRRFVIQRLPNKKSKQLYSLIFAIYVVMSFINTSAWAPITLSLCVIVPFLCLDKVKE
ncbi:MAG: hypothetical protein IJ341_01660 [Bacteroidales bacterium]|nr:hypothetical protein [Bacteroidales bacterium]